MAGVDGKEIHIERISEPNLKFAIAAQTIGFYAWKQTFTGAHTGKSSSWQVRV